MCTERRRRTLRQTDRRERHIQAEIERSRKNTCPARQNSGVAVQASYELSQCTSLYRDLNQRVSTQAPRTPNVTESSCVKVR